MKISLYFKQFLTRLIYLPVNRKFFFLLLVINLASQVIVYSQTTPLSFTTIPYNDPDIISPGRGAEQWDNGFQSIDNPAEGFPQQSLDVYYRFTWNRLEGPTQGSYDWKYFDEVVRECINKGQKLSFGIMTCFPDGNGQPGMVNYDNGNSAYPEYLHNMMQAEADQDWKTTGSGPTTGNASWVPNWNSTNYLGRLRALHEALYAHIIASSYTAIAGPHKSKTIAFKNVINSIDVRGYGSWGEWHSAGIIDVMTSYPAGRRPTAATLKTIIDHHVNVFTDFPLSIMISTFDAERLPNTDNPKEVTAYALSKRNNWGLLGWRRDNWGSLDDYINSYLKGNNEFFETSGPFNAIINERWKYAPVTGEPPGWASSLNGVCVYDDLERQVREYHATSIGNGNYGISNPPDCMKENIRAAFKAAGYRIILEGGSISSTISRSSPFAVVLKWKNVGIAPTYEKWDVVFELKDSSNITVWSGVSQFSPGTKLLTPPLSPSTAATSITDNFTLPASIPAGNYNLNVIIKDPNGYRAPLPLAITGRNPDGSYTIKNIKVGTTIPVTATLIGTVSLQGRTAPPNAQWQVPLQVDLYAKNDSALVGTYTVTTNQGGQFIINNIIPGTYHISVKNSHTLKKINLSQPLVAGNNIIHFGTLLEGDVNNDNYIDVIDSSLLMNSYNKSEGDAGFDSRADLNEDSTVTEADLLLLLNNYNPSVDSIPGGCLLPNATISNTSTCNGQPFNLVLSSAAGVGPFDVMVNGTTYTDIAIGGTITTVTPDDEKIWNANPSPYSFEDNAVELGVKFSSSVPGFVKGIRFYSSNNISGIYTGHLWTADGNLLASATFTNVTANGWQEVLFGDPVMISADTTYVASYFTSDGRYAATAGGLTDTVSNGRSLTTLSNATPNGNGVYKYGAPGFPSNSFNATNYWADVVFTPGTYKFNLMSVSDSIGCKNTGALQTLTVAPTQCAQGRPGGDSLSEEKVITTQTISSSVNEDKIQAEDKKMYTLGQNYPNPFGNETTIQYSLPSSAKVNLSLFDINGRLVKVLVNGSKEAGKHSVSFNSGSLSSGLYFYRIQAGKFSATKKMTVQ